MRNLLSSQTRSLPRRPRATRSRRMSLERLEGRELLTTISVSDASLNEIGDVSAFVAAGSGGLSSPKTWSWARTATSTSRPPATNSVIRYNPPPAS